MHWIRRLRATSSRPDVFGVLALLALAALPVDAEAAGFFFAPSGQAVEVRSVLAAWDVTDAQVDLQLAVEVEGDVGPLIWILPLEVPPTSVEATAPTALDDREAATTFSVLLPDSDPCPAAPPPPADKGCSCGGDAPTPVGTSTIVEPPVAMPPATVRAETLAESPVEVLPLLGQRTTELAARLSAAGVATTTTAEAQLDGYFARPGPVIWVRLPAAEAPGPRRLPSLKIAFDADAPLTLPMVATAPTAAPRLDLRVLVRAAGPYLSERWVGVVPMTDDLVYDAEGRTSYDAWVARASASGAGNFFALEAAVETGDAVTTRWYARPALEDLDLDPRFRPHPQASFRADPVLDLSAQPSLHVCNELVPERAPSPCGRIFCGDGAACLVVDGAPACRCPAGQAAAQIRGPDGIEQVTCTPTTGPGVPAGPDACADVDCGAGACLTRGARALCACDEGAAARPGASAPVCAPVPSDAETFGPGGGPEARASLEGTSTRGARSTRLADSASPSPARGSVRAAAAPAPASLLLLGSLAGAALVRRRARSAARPPRRPSPHRCAGGGPEAPS